MAKKQAKPNRFRRSLFAFSRGEKALMPENQKIKARTTAIEKEVKKAVSELANEKPDLKAVKNAENSLKMFAEELLEIEKKYERHFKNMKRLAEASEGMDIKETERIENQVNGTLSYLLEKTTLQFDFIQKAKKKRGIE